MGWGRTFGRNVAISLDPHSLLLTSWSWSCHSGDAWVTVPLQWHLEEAWIHMRMRFCSPYLLSTKILLLSHSTDHSSFPLDWCTISPDTSSYAFVLHRHTHTHTHVRAQGRSGSSSVYVCECPQLNLFPLDTRFVTYISGSFPRVRRPPHPSSCLCITDVHLCDLLPEWSSCVLLSSRQLFIFYIGSYLVFLTFKIH